MPLKPTKTVLSKNRLRPFHPSRRVLGPEEAPERIARRGTTDYTLTQAEFGRATEALFHYEATRRGLRVCAPAGAIPSYDVVVDNGVRLFKVQIKGLHARPTPYRCPRRNHVYSLLPWQAARKLPPVYDICAVYLADDNRWAFLDSAYRTCRGLAITTNGKHTKVGWEIFQPRW
jgi:hypothetical protein